MKQLQPKVASETKRLLAEQDTNLRNAAAILDEQIEEAREELVSLESDIKKLMLNRGKVEESLNDKVLKYEAILTNLEASRQAFKGLELDIIRLQEKIDGVVAKKLHEEREVSRLNTEKELLHNELIDLRVKEKQLHTSIDGLEKIYSEKEAEKQQLLVELDAKILIKSQEIDKIRTEEAAWRNDLAVWQRKLEEKDQNLRIRERNVEEGEGKIVQNSGLLNL